jgi:hypothetical protein
MAAIQPSNHSAQHYEFAVQQTLSGAALKLCQLSPEVVIGRSTLFVWSAEKHTVTLSDPFKSLLRLLTELETLKPKPDCKNLDVLENFSDLNNVLQQTQGDGGLMRKPGTERWEITNSPSWTGKEQSIESLLKQLGFIEPQPLSEQVNVNHSMVFGAHVKRMIIRVDATLKSMIEGGVCAETVFLLGSKRPLQPDEIDEIKNLLNGIENLQIKLHWENVFSKDGYYTEGNALHFLWDSRASDELRKKMIPICSTVHGASYNTVEGHRPTTEVTVDDWLPYYKNGEKQSIFAVVEQPFIRLQDTLMEKVITDAKRATTEVMTQRVSNTTFHFSNIVPPQQPLIGAQLDEIARNVYRTQALIKDLEKK